MRTVDMYWLPRLSAERDELRQLARAEAVTWNELVKVANTQLDFVQINRVDKLLQKHFAAEQLDDKSVKTLRVAILSSSTADHLVPGLRVAGLRRNFRVQTFLGDYGQYIQELQAPESELFHFKPNVLLFSFHAQHLLGSIDPALSYDDAAAQSEAIADKISQVWRLARQRFSGQIIQQTILPVYTRLMGSNEHRLPGSAAVIVDGVNARLRSLAISEGVDLLSIDNMAARDGLFAWHDPGLWHRAKQEISPAATPAYGDFAVRLMAAQQGRSAKCLVLDLDNTLWGGVIGDDGLEGIRLGQGSAIGEAFVSFQQYARDLARRGIILAVCSKNDIANAQSPFDSHPDMVLKQTDIACFIANWEDKPSNIRRIAEHLNIGIDSLVFVDDNPFERNVVRRELPMVAVPELPEEPALYAQCVADGGYFEGLQVTSDDFERGGQYRANAARESLRASHTDLASYLKSLNMELRWEPFDKIGQQRIVQLINKTNQFNLTTRRYTEQEVVSAMENPKALTLQLRLIDQFGDNGIIGIVIALPDSSGLRIDTWLMSCRVLGRQVEEATMNLVAAEAQRLGAEKLIGEFLPTKKNGMVREHYKKLGFACAETSEDGATRWLLPLENFKPFDTFISIIRSSTRG